MMQGDSATIASEERSIRLLQQQWMQAWVEQDLETLERILAPEYALIVSSMPERLVTREQWISMLSRYTAQSFYYDKMVVRVFDDVAVVSSLGTAGGAQIDGADRSMTFFLTDVWRKSGDRWRVVSRYSSMPETASASVSALTNSQ